MKGLILSLAVFLLYVVFTAFVSHFGRFARHSRLFVPSAVASVPLFALSYWFTPRDLWFVPVSYLANHALIDASLGAFILLLNIHSYVDWFFGFNGGFSTSMMLLLLSRDLKGATADELIAEYRDRDGRDKIHGWRIPRLIETGYLQIDPTTQLCTLTEKGRKIARFTRVLKSILNLGRGG